MNNELKALLRTDFTSFIQKVFTTVDPNNEYLYNWHIGLIAEYLIACQKGEIKRLIINIPPRHLKSISVAVAFPAWLLGHNPSEQIMCASYASALSKKHSMDCRHVIQSEWYKELFPKTLLVDDQNTQTKFVTTERGYRMATSVGGTTTGEGGNFLIVDDLHNAMQAESDIERMNANNWFDRSFSTRLNDKKKGCIIAIMQRLHTHDLTGHLMTKGGWELLKLPLIAEENESWNKGNILKKRNIGDLLHEERMSPKEIELQKIDLGPYGFAGQYQQRPTPEGGGKFKRDWRRSYEKIDWSNMNRYIICDPANSKRKKSDYTAVWVIGAAQDKNYYAIDIIRDRLNLKERVELIIDLHKKYQPLNTGYQCFGMEGDIQAIIMEQERINYRFNIKEIKNNAGKHERIERLVPPFAAGKIYLPKVLYKTNYEGKVIDVVNEFDHQEYEAFPVGLHDDMLDALAMIFDMDIIFPGNQTISYNRLYQNNEWAKL